ncbi:MAG: HD domain-containing protein [Bacillota bacterium]
MNKIIKRTRQLWRALTAKMTAADHALVSRFLNKTEQNLFFQMDVAIQKHCVNVAYTLEELLAGQANTRAWSPGPDTTLLIKAALLHDIGKITGRFTVLDRIWYVLVRKVSHRLARRIAKEGRGGWLTRLRNAFYIHVHHGELGSDLARQNGFTDKLIMLIRLHHDQERPDDSVELKLLRRADELN